MIKFITDFAPLIAFFIGYKEAGIKVATIYMVVTSIISVIIYFLIYRKLEEVTLISSGLLLVTAGMTIATNNMTFIKMKPTILYMLFAGMLAFGIYKKKPVLKYMLDQTIPLKSDKAWYDLSYRFVYFFLLLAVANEIIWRYWGEEIWVNFKVFGVIPVILIFVILQVPFLLKNKISVE